MRGGGWLPRGLRNAIKRGTWAAPEARNAVGSQQKRLIESRQKVRLYKALNSEKPETLQTKRKTQPGNPGPAHKGTVDSCCRVGAHVGQQRPSSAGEISSPGCPGVFIFGQPATDPYLSHPFLHSFCPSAQGSVLGREACWRCVFPTLRCVPVICENSGSRALAPDFLAARPRVGQKVCISNQRPLTRWSRDRTLRTTSSTQSLSSGELSCCGEKSLDLKAPRRGKLEL